MTKQRIIGYVLGLLTLFIGGDCLSQSAQEKGLAIMQEAEKRDTGWNNFFAEVTMVLKNHDGAVQKRELRVKTKEMANDGDKSLIIFDQPKDVRGSALLTYAHYEGNDDQWLYLPKIGRVKKLASRNKSGPFMGSEFAFEDIGSQEIPKFTYEFLKEAPCGDLDCFVVRRFPINAYSGYSSQEVWIDTKEYRTKKIDIFDRKKALLKTFTATDFKQFEGNFWRAMTRNMVNHQNGKSTDLLYSEFKFNQPLKDSDLTKNGLKRAL